MVKKYKNELNMQQNKAKTKANAHINLSQNFVVWDSKLSWTWMHELGFWVCSSNLKSSKFSFKIWK